MQPPTGTPLPLRCGLVPLVLTTWNLQGHRGVDVELVAARVAELGAHVLLLQEVQRRQARGIARALGARSLGWTFKHWTGSVPAEGMAVVGVTRPAPLRRALATTHRWRWWSYRRRIAQVAEVALGEARPEGRGGAALGLRLVNVHLTPHDAGVQLRRRETGGLIRRFVPPAPDGTGDRDRGRAPVVVAGDFNARPLAEMFQQMRAAGLRDAWSEVHGDDPAAGLTNWSGEPADVPPDQRLDYVWVSDDLAVKDVDVPAHGQGGFEQLPLLSDHLPVTVTLALAR
jgi:endonuclease/exonuclease/phosphatase family metal-dependent hydrolase